MFPRNFLGFAILASIGIGALLTAAAMVSAPTITLEREVHFTAANGDDVVVGPGTFEVESVQEGIRLKPKDGKPEDAKVIQANPTPHPEQLQSPKAVAEAVGDDAVRLALLQPDGSGLEASGSFSGVRTRAAGTSGTNIAIGYGALGANTTGSANTAIGYVALRYNTIGTSNTATGTSALELNTTGNGNTATGASALRANTTGNYNTATGANALALNTTGNANTAIGNSALASNTTGNANTAIGNSALTSNTTGSNNIAIGHGTGSAQTTGSANIYLSHRGVAGESGTIRIGTIPSQSRAFIAGIAMAVSGTPVVVAADGQLGLQGSSLRYKDDVRDMGTASRELAKLRPVTFKYKSDVAGSGGGRSREYGLIAEEVAEVYPELVGRNSSGEIVTVKYHELIPMLLNELQRQQRRNEDQDRRSKLQDSLIMEQNHTMQALTTQLGELRGRMSAAGTRE
jgi:hypothetical protein